MKRNSDSSSRNTSALATRLGWTTEELRHAAARYLLEEHRARASNEVALTIFAGLVSHLETLCVKMRRQRRMPTRQTELSKRVYDVVVTRSYFRQGRPMPSARARASAGRAGLVALAELAHERRATKQAA